jgi:hypothetical protein
MIRNVLFAAILFSSHLSWSIDPTTFLRLNHWMSTSQFEQIDTELNRQIVKDRFGNAFEVVFGKEDRIKNAILASWRVEITGLPNSPLYPTFVQNQEGNFVPGYVRALINQVTPNARLEAHLVTQNMQADFIQLMEHYGISSHLTKIHNLFVIEDFLHVAPQGTILEFSQNHSQLMLAEKSLVKFPPIAVGGPLTKKPAVEALWSLFWADENGRSKLLTTSSKHAALSRYSSLMFSSSNQQSGDLIYSTLRRAQDDWTGLYEILPNLIPRESPIADYQTQFQIHLNPTNASTLVVVPLNDNEARAIVHMSVQANAKKMPITEGNDRRGVLSEATAMKIIEEARRRRIQRVVLVELPELTKGLEDRIRQNVQELVIVDHHTYPHIDRYYPLSSLEQVATILGYKLSGQLKIIAVRDRSGPAGVANLGLSKEEIWVDDFNPMHEHLRRTIVQEIETRFGVLTIFKGEMAPIGTTGAFVFNRHHPKPSFFMSINDRSLKVTGNPMFIKTVKEIAGHYPYLATVEGGDSNHDRYLFVRGIQSAPPAFFNQLKRYLAHIATKGETVTNIYPFRVPKVEHLLIETNPNRRFDFILQLDHSRLTDHDRQRLISFFRNTYQISDLVALILKSNSRESDEGLLSSLIIPLVDLLRRHREEIDQEFHSIGQSAKILSRISQKIDSDKRRKDVAYPLLDNLDIRTRILQLRNYKWNELPPAYQDYLLSYVPARPALNEFVELMRLAMDSKDVRWLNALPQWKSIMTDRAPSPNEKVTALELLSQVDQYLRESTNASQQHAFCQRALKE